MRPGWYGGYYNHYNHNVPFMYGARFRLFPRLFWFALGAGAYAYWAKSEERHRAIAAGAGHNGEWRHWSNNHWGCHRRREQLEQRQEQHQGSNEPNVPAQPTQLPASPPPPPAPPMTAAPASAQSPAPAYSPTPPAPNSTEWQAERFREASKQASETVSDMSEKAIDALMANLQTLKAKIAEAREARKMERPHFEQRDDKQNPRDGSPPQ